MKASLSKKVLFLSLTTLALVGTGCERQGRAPSKVSLTTPGGTQAVASADKKVDPNAKPSGTPSGTPATQNADVLKKPPVVEAPSCRINLAPGVASAETFAGDIAAMKVFRECMEKLGVVLKLTTTMDELDKSIYIVAETGDDRAGIQKERAKGDLLDTTNLHGAFNKLAKAKDSDDDQAARIMEGRIALLKSESKKMYDKYVKADQSLEITLEKERRKAKVSTVVTELELIQEISDKALKEIAGYKSVASDGADTTDAEDESSSK